MRLGLFFLATTLLWACNATEQAIPESKVFTYLALGDSYTIGHSLPAAERYPNQLADSLAKNATILSPVDIVAKTGWTTDELDAGINERMDLQETYDLSRRDTTKLSRFGRGKWKLGSKRFSMQ